MGNAFGRDLVLGMAAETASYNEAWGTPTLVGIYIDPNPVLVPNKDFLKEIHAHGWPMLKTDEIAQGVINNTIRISGKVPKEGFSWLLRNLCGKVTTTAFTATHKKHVFDLTATTPQSLKLVLQNPIKGTSPLQFEWQLSGCMMRSLEFTFEINQPDKFTAEFVGGNWAIANATSSVTIPVPTAGNPFWWFNDSSTSILYPNLTPYETANSITVRFESNLADDLDDSYRWGSDSRILLQRASTEEAFKITVIMKSTLLSQARVGEFRDFTSVAFILTHGTMAADTYGFKMLEDIAFKITDHTLVRKGLGLIHEQWTLEGVNQLIAEPTLFTTIDKQTTPVTDT